MRIMRKIRLYIEFTCNKDDESERNNSKNAISNQRAKEENHASTRILPHDNILHLFKEPTDFVKENGKPNNRLLCSFHDRINTLIICKLVFPPLCIESFSHFKVR